MGNTWEDVNVDATSPLKMEKKKKKKSKNKTSDGDGDSNIHVDLQNEKVHEHSKKKKKSESKEDLEEDNGDIQKKRKREKTQTKENEDDSKPKKHKKKMKKSNENEDGGDKGENLEDNGDLQKKKKDFSEKTQTKENDEDPKPKKHKKKKKKSKSNEDEGDKGNNLENNGDVQTKPKKKKPKKVTFSCEVEIFPTPPTKKPKKRRNPQSDDKTLVRGKRFTPEEDETVKQAVQNYIISNNLGDDGLKMILNCKAHKGISKCWQEIATCLPYRPYTSVYYRAHILFEKSKQRGWTPEEITFLKESYKKHGNKWKMIAEDLGKHRFHVKDTWRRIKLDGLKTGKWTQDEYQGLYDMVNLDLQMKVSGQESKKSKHGMLRDNIPWTAISEKLNTRSDATCCSKWYEQLSSSLVKDKVWCDADDYWLVGRLYEIDAACVEDVDWDDLLEHRSGEVCRKRWDQMVVRIGDHRSKTFGEQVEILAKRYRPELAEDRQTWDDKPVVP